MFDAGTIAGTGTALLAGLMTSLHCAGMCGPLGCLLAPRRDAQTSFLTLASTYQVARLLSYTLAGAVAGGLGLLALSWTGYYWSSAWHWLPWALPVLLLSLALRLDRYLPRPAGLQRLSAQLSWRWKQLPQPLDAGLLGLLTPLLPCGPLYLILAVALMTQSPTTGAELLLAFGLGTLPLLWLTQAGIVRFQSRLNLQRWLIVQRSVAAVAALVLSWRLLQGPGLSGEGGPFCGF